MCKALNAFDGGLKKNRCVRIGPKGGGWITLTPLDAQPDPPNLIALKTELNAIWPMTSLLDMVKETDLRLGFIDVLKSPTAYEVLGRSVLQPLLLLCLHRIGTNARATAHGGSGIRCDRQGLGVRPPTLYQQRGRLILWYLLTCKPSFSSLSLLNSFLDLPFSLLWAGCFLAVVSPGAAHPILSRSTMRCLRPLSPR
jgi:hypothetical protein